MFLPAKRNNIFRALDQFDKEFESFGSFMDDVSHFFGRPTLGGLQNPSVCPQLSAIELDNEYQIDIEVPGIQEENIDISLNDNALVITGEKKDQYTKNKGNVHVDERYYGRFRREIRTPSNCDINNIKAYHKNGILTITIPKIEEVKPEIKKIEIKSLE